MVYDKHSDYGVLDGLHDDFQISARSRENGRMVKFHKCTHLWAFLDFLKEKCNIAFVVLTATVVQHERSHSIHHLPLQKET